MRNTRKRILKSVCSFLAFLALTLFRPRAQGAGCERRLFQRPNGPESGFGFRVLETRFRVPSLLGGARLRTSQDRRFRPQCPAIPRHLAQCPIKQPPGYSHMIFAAPARCFLKWFVANGLSFCRVNLAVRSPKLNSQIQNSKLRNPRPEKNRRPYTPSLPPPHAAIW